MSSEHTVYFILIFICLLFSAFFSSAEVAVVSLSRIRIKHLVSQGVKWASVVEKLREKPGIFLSAILLGNTLVNMAIASIGTVIAVRILGDNWGALAATLILTTIVLIFGEVIPKTFAAHHYEKVALIYALPVRIVIWILYPFVWLSEQDRGGLYPLGDGCR